MKCPKCSHDAPKMALRCPKCMAPMPKAEPAKGRKAPAPPPAAFPISPGNLAIAAAVLIAVGSILLLRRHEAKRAALERQQAAAAATRQEEEARLKRQKAHEEEVTRLKAQLEEDARNAAMNPFPAFGEGIPAFPGARPAGKTPGQTSAGTGENPPLPPAFDTSLHPPEVVQDLRKEIMKQTQAEQHKGN